MSQIDQQSEPVFELLDRLKGAINILIQHSENHYVMSELREANKTFADSKTFGLTRQAVGFEIVNRIYRLTDKFEDSENFDVLKQKYLENKLFVDKLFSNFNSDNRKTRLDFDCLLQDVVNMIADLYQSSELKRLKVFRQPCVCGGEKTDWNRAEKSGRYETA